LSGLLNLLPYFIPPHNRFIVSENKRVAGEMANNNGRQGGGGGTAQMNEHVEFTVKVRAFFVIC
jgi:hypothetical protein